MRWVLVMGTGAVLLLPPLLICLRAQSRAWGQLTPRASLAQLPSSSSSIKDHSGASSAPKSIPQLPLATHKVTPSICRAEAA